MYASVTHRPLKFQDYRPPSYREKSLIFIHLRDLPMAANRIRGLKRTTSSPPHVRRQKRKFCGLFRLVSSESLDLMKRCVSHTSFVVTV